MDVQLQLDLNEEEERGFKDLILLCNKEDETDYDTGLDYDFFYSIRNEEKKESGLKEAWRTGGGKGYPTLYSLCTSLYAGAGAFYHVK